MWLGVLMLACTPAPEEGGRGADTGGGPGASSDTSGMSTGPRTDSGETTDTGEPDTAGTTPFVTPTGPLSDFVFQGSGYGAHHDLTVYLALTWLDAPAQVAWRGSTVVSPDGRIDATFADAVVEGASYVLYWYVDRDADGACSELPTDFAWSTEPPGLWGGLGLDVGPVEGDLVFALAGNTAYDFDGCAVFGAR